MTTPDQQSGIGQVSSIVQAVVARVPNWLVVCAGIAFVASLVLWKHHRDYVAYGVDSGCHYLGDYDDSTIKKCVTFIESGNGNAKSTAFAYLTLGDIYEKKHDIELAIKNYTEATRVNPNYSGHFIFLGDALIKRNSSGDCTAAISVFTRAIELDPTSSIHFQRRGRAYMCNHDYKSALDDDNEAIRLNPIKSFYYSQRAAVWGALGDVEKAATDVAEAVSLEDRKDEALCKDMKYGMFSCWGYRSAWW